jgi:hypothetical protein
MQFEKRVYQNVSPVHETLSRFIVMDPLGIVHTFIVLAFMFQF